MSTHVDAFADLRVPLPVESSFANHSPDGWFAESDCEAIYAPALKGVNAAIFLVEQADGWRSGYQARLSKSQTVALPRVAPGSEPCATRAAAIVDGAEGLIAWCAETKLVGSAREAQLAHELQEWALELVAKYTAEMREGTLAVRSTAPLVATWEPPQIDVAQIQESPKNPRKYFSEKGMAELTASIRVSGVRTPVLLRILPEEGGYMIAAGHRRFRAAKAAGLTTVPAIARIMTDAEFLELVSFENLSREDVRPLEEAAGFKLWMEETGAKVKDVAEKTGVSARQVYDRLALLKLPDLVQSRLWDGKLTVGHAVLMTFLPSEAEQLEALKACYWNGELVSVRRFKDWLRRCHQRDLSRAPFALDIVLSDRSDAAAWRDLPVCDGCRYRGEGEESNECRRSVCYDAKVAAYVELVCRDGAVAISTQYQPSNELPAGVRASAEYVEVDNLDEEDEEFEDDDELQDQEDGVGPGMFTKGPPAEDKAEPDCGHAVLAVVAHDPYGRNVGKTQRVCMEPSCPVHGERLAAHSKLYAGSDPEEANRKRLAEERKRQAAERLKERTATMVRDAIGAKAAVPYGKRELLIVALSIVKKMWHDLLVKVAKAYEIEPVVIKHSYGGSQKNYEKPMAAYLSSLGVTELAQVVIDLSLWQSPELQEQAAKDYKIDVKAIGKSAAAAEKEKAAAKVQTSAKASKGKAAKAKKTGKGKAA